MIEYEVKIVGRTPYMQHRMDDVALADWEKKRGFIIERNDVNKEDLDRALYHAYINEDNEFYIPKEQIKGALINAGALTKSKVGNAKKSMKNIVAGMFFIKESTLPLGKDFVIDKRSAVNKNVKARVICVRPKWNKWETTFTLQVDNDTITDQTVRKIIEDAGTYIGIGSFRPQNNGEFGRFNVIGFTKL